MRSWVQRTASLFLFTVSAAGCAAEDVLEEDETTDEAAQEVVVPVLAEMISSGGGRIVGDNGIAANAVVGNAVVGNAVVGNAVVGNALTATNITANTALMTALQDPTTEGEHTRTVLRYMYECAMPPSSSLTILDDFTLEGKLGLAETWGTAACDETCKQWVSACILARVNGYGVPIEISLRGPHPKLTADLSEKALYSRFEGRFWGKVFDGDANTFYACTGSGTSTAQLTGRVCAAPGGDCGITVVGKCSDFCSLTTKLCRESSSVPYQKAIETWVQPPPAGNCGDGICQVGEDSGLTQCSEDCPATTEAKIHSKSESTAQILASTSDGSALLYAGVTTASSKAENLLGGLPLLGVTDTPLSTRDMFIVRADQNGTIQKVQRVPMGNNQVPVAMAVHSSQVYIATQFSLHALDAATLQTKWTVTDDNSAFRMVFSRIRADAQGVHVVGRHQKNENGSWLQHEMGYRRYKLNDGAVDGSSFMPFDPSAALGLSPCGFFRAMPSGSAVVTWAVPVGPTPCPSSTTSTVTRTVNGISDPVPQFLVGSTKSGEAGTLFMAGKSESSSKVFLAKTSGVAQAWAWNIVLTAEGDDGQIAITSLQTNRGSVLITGTYAGTVQFGKMFDPQPRNVRMSTLTAEQDGFIAAYSASDGKLLWARTYGGPGEDGMKTVAVTGTETTKGMIWGFGSFIGDALTDGQYVQSPGSLLKTAALRVGVGPLTLVPPP
jgi:hypothetical protein